MVRQGKAKVAENRVRKGTVDGMPLIVIDDLLPNEQTLRLFHWLNGSPFTRTESARPDTQAFLHWAVNVAPQDCKNLPLYQPTIEALAQYLPEHGPQRLYRSYCNLCSYGDMLFTHTDVFEGEQGFTALWYIAPQWDLEWGGETLFFDKTGDPVFVVGFKPGRLAIFDGSIRHAGKPPNKVCVLPRLTFALKFTPETTSS